MEQARIAAQKLAHPLVDNVSDTFTSVSNTMSNQQNLVTSFTALITKIEPLLKIGDEVAKVNSCLLLYRTKI
jgi:hypothetical protein